MLALSVDWIRQLPANKVYSFLHIFIRTRQSGMKLLSEEILVSKRIQVIKEVSIIKLLNPFLAEDEDEEQEIRIVKRVEDYYPEDKFSARYEIKVTKQCLCFNRNYLQEVFFGPYHTNETLKDSFKHSVRFSWNWNLKLLVLRKFFSFCSNVIQSFPYVCSAP